MRGRFNTAGKFQFILLDRIRGCLPTVSRERFRLVFKSPVQSGLWEGVGVDKLIL
jgi:hypothetical protein